MTVLVHAISAALIHFLWQGLLVWAVLSVVLALLAGRSARVRYLCACGALAAMAVLPVITAGACRRLRPRPSPPRP